MKNYSALLLTSSLLFAAVAPAIAQKSDNPPPPNILVVQREMLKPGKSGSPHMKTESAFVKAFADAKMTTAYIGLDSLSGPTRAVFLAGYDSFAEWGKDLDAMRTNASFGAAMDTAIINDGDLLSEFSQSVYAYRKDLSYNDHIDAGAARYWEIMIFTVKPGHEAEWAAINKLYIDHYAKVAPNSQWVTFQSLYGKDNGGVFAIFLPFKSMPDADQGFMDGVKFVSSLSPDEQKKLSDLAAACIESTQVNLFAVNPKMSYPAPAWVKSDPAFWNSK
jgi:hypothetical protein